MSHRISIQDAKEKLSWEQHCQELNKAGIPVDRISRYEKKRRARMSKYERFVAMLKKRGGYYLKPKKEEKTENVNAYNESAK